MNKFLLVLAISGPVIGGIGVFLAVRAQRSADVAVHDSFMNDYDLGRAKDQIKTIAGVVERLVSGGSANNDSTNSLRSELRVLEGDLLEIKRKDSTDTLNLELMVLKTDLLAIKRSIEMLDLELTDIKRKR